ncbi:MAG TPA: MlaD family protein, partial [Actinomycetota bacterium]|nr:MlaD family protein [Actinomycetota bacterium]
MRNPLRGALHRSFLERNQVVIGVVGTVVVAVLSGLALMLTGGVFQNTYEVTAFFEDAAAIRPGDSVTVAGLDAGQVDDVRLSNDRVAIDLAIDSDVRLTKDTEAEIKVETLLGKKVIALEPGGSAEPLSDGDT